MNPGSMNTGGEDRDDREWAGRLAALPRKVAPAHDPWPQIAARISGARLPRPGAARRAWWPLASAAALVLALGVALVLRTSQEPAGSSRTAASMPLAPAYADAMHVTELEYVAALREVEALAREGVPSVIPDGEDVDRGWLVMRAAEDEVVAALRRNPDDAYVSQRLVALRARQVDMLRQIASAELASWRQTI